MSSSQPVQICPYSYNAYDMKIPLRKRDRLDDGVPAPHADFPFPKEYGGKKGLIAICEAVGQGVAGGSLSFFVESPRYDFFIFGGKVVMPFLTFDEFVAGPGRWLPQGDLGSSYKKWLLCFRGI